MAGFDNDTMYASNVDFSGSTTPAPTVTLNGQLLIGSTAAPNIRVATLTAGAGITITNGAGAITIAATGGITPLGGLTPDAFTPPGTSPVVGDGSGNIIVTGAQVAAGVVGTNVIRTDSLAANSMTIEIQRATTAAVSTPADNGVAHFDNTIFTVGAGGFVSLVGGAVPPVQKVAVDASTPPGTNPVVASGLGVLTITGGQVASGVIGTNVIRTDSLNPDTFTIEIQRSAAVAASDVTKNGVSHFDSSIFTVGANGFVSLVGGAVPPVQKFAVDTSTPPGTNPVVATAGGIVTVTGGQVATGVVGTNVIRTDSVAANAYKIEIQRSTAVAGSDVTKNGVAHFNSANFTVDSNGFVSSIGGGGTGAWQFIETKTAASSANLNFNTSLSNFTELMFTYSSVSTNGSTFGLLFAASADNGATFIIGNRSVLGGSAYNDPTVFFANTLYQAAYPTSDPSSGSIAGYFVIQNTPGTLPRMSWGDGFGAGRVFNIIGTSAQINYIRFSSQFTFSGQINVFGR